MDAIAARSGVSKATIYRWWPNRAAVAMDTLLEAAGPSTLATQSGCALADLRQHMETAVSYVGGPAGKTLAGLVADAQHDPDLAETFRHRYLTERRAIMRQLIERAIADGQLRADLDVELTIDMFVGPLYYRLLLGHAPISGDLAPQLVEHILRGAQ